MLGGSSRTLDTLTPGEETDHYQPCDGVNGVLFSETVLAVLEGFWAIS